MLLLLRLADPGCPTILQKTQSTSKTVCFCCEMMRFDQHLCTQTVQWPIAWEHAWGIFEIL